MLKLNPDNQIACGVAMLLCMLYSGTMESPVGYDCYKCSADLLCTVMVMNDTRIRRARSVKGVTTRLHSWSSCFTQSWSTLPSAAAESGEDRLASTCTKHFHMCQCWPLHAAL